MGMRDIKIGKVCCSKGSESRREMFRLIAREIRRERTERATSARERYMRELEFDLQLREIEKLITQNVELQNR